MDRRIYVLPLISIFIVVTVLFNPQITGFMVGKPSETKNTVSANVSIFIRKGGLIPENSLVTVYLDNRSSSMNFKEFVNKAGGRHDIVYGEISEIGYNGTGYTGPYGYAVDISEFGIGADVAPGTHNLTVEVGYGNYVISSTTQEIEV
jgi:hypothetical protein